MSLLKSALREKTFVCVMEFVPKPSAQRFAAMQAIMARGHLCGWPMTLANGPCGGTSLNRCEFGDRECIHSVKYRTAKTVHQTAVLSERLIPCIEVQTRHRSSWPQWFEAQPVRRLSPQPAPRTQPES